MNEKNTNVGSDVKKRMYVWSLNLIRTLDALPYRTSSDILSKQLIRSGTSVVANYLEAQAAVSRKDFTNFMAIALKSANEFSRILGASVVTLKKKR